MERDLTAARRPRPARIAQASTGTDSGADGVGVWLLVKLPNRPMNISHFLDQLAEPDFRLESCREAGLPTDVHERGYRAHWYCSFSPLARDNFASLRLLKRLAGADFDILRYESLRDG